MHKLTQYSVSPCVLLSYRNLTTSALLLLLLLSALLFMPSCGSEQGLEGSGRTTAKTDDDWLNAFDTGSFDTDNDSRSTEQIPNEQGWTIVLATFGRQNHQTSAEQMKQDFIAATGMPNAWVDSTDSRSILQYGRYRSHNDPNAQADKNKIQQTIIGGKQIFARAFLLPMKPTNEGGNSKFNLLSAREQFPNSDELFSLQIAFYSIESNASNDEGRLAAEKCVEQLRVEGETAFYFHGSTKSHVTVGIFFGEDIDPVLGYSPAVLDLQRRYPYNIGNGKNILETRRLDSGRVIQEPQSSFLIRVPDK